MQKLPNDILCIDSLRVFWGIDELLYSDPTFQSKHDGVDIPQGVYKLENMYKRKFNKSPEEKHQAEADVNTLMHLIVRVYAKNFLAYAENHATPLGI